MSIRNLYEFFSWFRKDTLLEELFYYNRRKCLSHGLFLVFIILLVNPFSWLISDGLAGALLFAFFLPPLVRGINHILKSLLPFPAMKLTPDFLEVDTFYFGRQKIEWRDVREIQTAYSKGGVRLRVAGIAVRLPFLLGNQFVTITLKDGKRIDMNLDALKLEGRNLELFLRDYKLGYFPKTNKRD